MLLLSACSSSKPAAQSSPSTTPPADRPTPWPAPAAPMARARAAGLVPETAESLEYHVHAHLDVFVNGTQITVPAGIGIDTRNPAVHTFTIAGARAYGGIAVPCDQPCISPLHTHDVSGVLHTESATQKDNTLGQFFTEWNVRLDGDCVATYCRPATPIGIFVGGTRYTGDPRSIPLGNLKEIAIVIGTPPAQIPSTFDQGLI